MRTNIVLDDELVREAMSISGIRTRKELVHKALKLLVETECAAKTRERYDSRVADIQQKTARLKLRESAHQIIRADRDRR